MAGADFVARLSVISQRAAAFAADTTPISLADTFPRGGIASQCMLQTAIAALRTILPKPTRFTLLVTPFSGPSSRTRTLTIDWIADTVIRAVASFVAVLPEVMRITGSIAADTLPTRRTEALAALRRTRSPIQAFASLTAILAVGSIATLFLAIIAFVTGDAVTRPVDVVARRIVLAVARDRASLSVSQEWTRPVAQSATPAWIAQALSGPRMAHLGVIYIALALTGAVHPVSILRTDPRPTIRSCPTGSAVALPGGRIANGSIQTPARLRAVDAVLVAGARVQTFGTHKPRYANTLPSHMVTVGSVEALTLLLTPHAISPTLAAISTYRSGITGRTNTLTRL